MNTITKYTKEQVNEQDGNCGCCGEPEQNLYENPWGGTMNSYGMTYDCIMDSMELSYDNNYEGGYDLTTDIEYWKNEYKKYKKTLEEKIYTEKDGSKWKIVGNTSIRV